MTNSLKTKFTWDLDSFSKNEKEKILEISQIFLSQINAVESISEFVYKRDCIVR